MNWTKKATHLTNQWPFHPLGDWLLLGAIGALYLGWLHPLFVAGIVAVMFVQLFVASALVTFASNEVRARRNHMQDMHCLAYQLRDQGGPTSREAMLVWNRAMRRLTEPCYNLYLWGEACTWRHRRRLLWTWFGMPGVAFGVALATQGVWPVAVACVGFLALRTMAAVQFIGCCEAVEQAGPLMLDAYDGDMSEWTWQVPHAKEQLAKENE